MLRRWRDRQQMRASLASSGGTTAGTGVVWRLWTSIPGSTA
jgi:hypothetical protein